MSDELSTYGHVSLSRIPEPMTPWGLRLVTSSPSEYGEYALVGCEPADLEWHHQVVVIDEAGQPLPGVQIVSAPNRPVRTEGTSFYVASR